MQDRPHPIRSPEAALFSRWRTPFFYGWVIVAVVFIAEFTAAGMGGITVGLFFKPISDTYGWSLTQFTGAITASAIAGMIVSPFVGPLLDRFGARPVMVFGALVAGGGLLLLTSVQELWQFWVIYAVVGALGLGEMGQLTGPVVVAKWFIRRRGRAMAIATLGTLLGGVVLAPIIGILLDQVGWRSTWSILGVSLLVVMVPILLLFMRRQPEDLGMLPDGDVAAEHPASGSLKEGGSLNRQQEGLEETWTMREALHTRSLWLLVLAMNLISLSASAITIHMVPYFTNQVGMSAQAASYILSIRLLGAALGRIPWGLIVERVPVQYCLAIVFFGRALGPLTLVLTPAPYNIVPFIILSGVIGGNLGLLQPMTFSNYFGRAFIGSIQGMLRPLLGISSLAGPLAIASLYDASGTFDRAFLITGSMGLLATVVVLFATPPVRRAQR